MYPPEELRNRFTFHPANEETGKIHAKIRTLHLALAEELNRTLPDGREKSLAVTHLEESMLWSNASIARNT